MSVKVSDEKLNKAINTFKNNVVFELIAISSVLYGYWQSVDEIKLPTVILLLIGAILAGAFFASAFSAYRRVSARPLPPSDGDFVPFRGSDGWEPLKRKQVTKELSELVFSSEKKHVLLVSPSGTGKSTMLYDLIPASLPGFQVRHYDAYQGIVQSVLLDLQEIADDTDLTERTLELIRSIESGRLADAALYEEIKSVIYAIPPEARVLLCFDQVERYFLRAESVFEGDYARYSREHNSIKILLKCISENPTIRTLFAIRSEYIFGSLSSMFNIRTNGVDIDEYVEFYFLWGLNYIDDKSDYASLSKKLVAEFDGISLRDRLFRICSIENQMKANTFLLNLGGYLFEKFQARPKVFERLLRPMLSADEIVDEFLDAAFEGFTAATGSSDRTLFDTVLYALANENKVSGQSCSISRLAGLAHYPVKDVASVVNYLSEVNVITTDDIEVRRSYRLGHEKISDRILKSDKIDLDSRAIDGIRYLTENRIRTENLTVPSSFPNSLDFYAISQFSISYLSVVIFVIFGFLRCFSPDGVYEAINSLGIYDALWAVTGLPRHSYYFEPAMYVPHFIAHVAWVSYIDRVNRSFLCYASSGFLRLASASLSTIGMLFGIVVAYSPELFVVPIVVVGILYGLVLMALSRTPLLGGQMKSIAFAWGYRSIVNVTVVLGVSLYVLVPFFQIEGPTGEVPVEKITDVLILIIFESLMMLWFWQHIKAEQNARRIWSANLALFDKGRIFGR